jgi:formylglycine-generating enzyme required for sulfatase activity
MVIAPAVAKGRERGFTNGRALDPTSRAIGYLGALHDGGVIGGPELLGMAQRWHREGRLVNPVPDERVIADSIRQVHHEGITELFAGELDGDAVARWAEQRAVRSERSRRARRAARKTTQIPYPPLQFVKVEGGRLEGTTSPRSQGHAYAVASFQVQTDLVTQGQWLRVMGTMPDSYSPAKKRRSWRVRGRTVHVDLDEPLKGFDGAEVAPFLARLNAGRRPDQGRYDLVSDVELELLMRRRSGNDGSVALPDGTVRNLYAATRVWVHAELRKSVAKRTIWPILINAPDGRFTFVPGLVPGFRLVIRGAP